MYHCTRTSEPHPRGERKWSRSSLPRLTAAAVIAAAVMAGGVGLATAGVDGDVRAGYYFDSERAHIGGGFLMPLSSGSLWYFNPNLELALSDRSDLFALSGDFHYDFHHKGNTTLWVGAGPSLLIEDNDVDSDASVGLNGLFGIGAARGAVRPFGQFKAILSDNSEVVLTGGIRF